MGVEARQIVSLDEWLSWRRRVVTASRIGALPAFHVHPYCTPLKLYAELRGVEFPNDDNKLKRRGRWLEPAIARACEELRPEWKIEPPGIFLVDEEIGWGAT